MAITLKNLLKVGGLRACKVVAGRMGIHKTVSNVTIMEVPDIVKWLKGNELLLTSLYPIKDDLEAQIELFDNLNEVGTTALAIKASRFVNSIPEEMIKKADQYQITLIEIPEEISYLDILSPAMNAILNQKVVLQEDLEHATRLLNEISIANGNFLLFTETLSFLTKSKVYLESHVPFIEITDQEEWLMPMTPDQLKELEVVQRPVRMLRYNRDQSEESCIVAPIVIDAELYGTITCWDYQTELMEVDLAIQEKAATLLSLEFLRKKVKYEIEQQYKNEFIRDVLFNQEMNVQDLIERGRIYGFQESESYISIIVREKAKSSDEVFAKRLSRIESSLRGVERDIIVGNIRNALVLLMPVKGKTEKELQKYFEKSHFLLEQAVHQRLWLGIGSKYAGVRGIRKSFREAERAITLGPRLWPKKTMIHFNHLGVYRLISLIENHQELQNYYDESIMKLVAYDMDNDLNLIETLEQYFICNESLKETANHLFVHVNTLKYRLQKIKQITGLNLQNAEDKLTLHIGLKIHQYLSVIIDKDKNNTNLLSE